MKKLKFLLTCILVSYLYSSASAQINLQHGLELHYAMDYNSQAPTTVPNLSTINPNTYNGLISTATAPTPTQGVNSSSNNTAYYFDGVNDLITVPNSTNFQITDVISISVWIKTNYTPSSNYSPAIIDRLESSDGYGIRITNAGKARLTINGGNADVISTTTVADGNWHHIYTSYSKFDGELKIYVDGVLEDVDTYSSQIQYVHSPRFNIGYIGAGNCPYYKGDIDDLRIYNRILNNCEIAFLANNYSTAGIASNRLAHFTFTGSSIDVSGNNNNSTFNNATLTTDRFGNPNSAYEFNPGILNQSNGDYIQLPDSTNINPDSLVTVTAWVKILGGMPQGGAIYDRVSSNEGFGLQLTSDFKVRMTINGGDQDVISIKSINRNMWVFVACTYSKDSANMKVYINGILAGTKHFNQPQYITYNSSTRNNIGVQLLDPTHKKYFYGCIDDLRIYDFEMSECEMKHLFNLESGQVVHSRKANTDVSIEESSTNISVYPNPVNDNRLTIEAISTFDEIKTVQIFDITGKEMIRTSFTTEKQELNISLLSAGTYIVKVKSNCENYTRKIIVQ